MATRRPGPSYQHLRTYNSGVNGDGQPLPSDLVEGEISINLSTQRMYSARQAAEYFPAVEGLASDSDFIRIDSDFGFPGSNYTLVVGTKIRVFSMTGFDSETLPFNRRYAGITLEAPTNTQTVTGLPTKPASLRWRMNGGLDSDVSAFAAVRARDFMPTPTDTIPYLHYTNPSTFDSDTPVVEGGTGLPGIAAKIALYVDNANNIKTDAASGGIPAAQLFWGNDSELPNRYGWNVYFDNTRLSPAYPDSGTLYIWYDSALPQNYNTLPAAKPANITPDSDFVRYFNYTQEPLYAVIQSASQTRPNTQFPFYDSETIVPGSSFVELLVDATLYLPEFTTRVFTSAQPFRTTTILKNTGPANCLLLQGLRGNEASQTPNLQTWARLRQLSGENEIFKVNNVPYVAWTPPGYSVPLGSAYAETGEFWIDNYPGNGGTREAANPGVLNWLDDTLSGNAYVQSVARGYAQQIHTLFPAFTNIQIRDAMLSGVYNPGTDSELYPARQLVFDGADSEVLSPTTTWYEWRTIPSVSNLDPQPETRAYIPDYGLRLRPDQLGRYVPFDNPTGVDSDAWGLFIGGLNIVSPTARQVRRVLGPYYGTQGQSSRGGVNPPGWFVASLANSVEVFANGVRLLEGVDFNFTEDKYIVPTAMWSPRAQDATIIVYYTPAVNDTVASRNVQQIVSDGRGSGAYQLDANIGADYQLTDVYINGVLQIPQEDYTFQLISTLYYVVFAQPPQFGDVISLLGYTEIQVSTLVNNRQANYVPQADYAANTTFGPFFGYVADGPDFTSSNGIDVLVNGVSLDVTIDYSYTSSAMTNETYVTLVNPIRAQDRLKVILFTTATPSP